DEQTLKVWEMTLQDIDDRDFERGVMLLMRTREKPPVNMAAAILKEIEADNFSAEEAWGTICQEMSRTGYYGTPKFEDPAIAKAVELMNWKEICNTLSKDMGVTRAHFYRTYEACRKRATMTETYKMIQNSATVKQLVEKIGKVLPG
ncbi:MAG: hypothetical protein O8C67_02005, partial [Candidatus Methanoperedens sp.]|nr:hypothetical protein [Candidatus Methanoperedens sp.]